MFLDVLDEVFVTEDTLLTLEWLSQSFHDDNIFLRCSWSKHASCMSSHPIPLVLDWKLWESMDDTPFIYS